MTGVNMERYRHFYLYAKGHYLKSDIIEDLRKITAEYCMFDIADTTVYDIVSGLSMAVKPYIDFEKFINDLMLFETYSDNINNDFELILIQTMLSTVKFVDKKSMSRIGEPDPTILPLNTKGD